MTATQTKLSSGSSASESLPKPFVTSMRTLFDIMDDQQTGYVKLSGRLNFSYKLLKNAAEKL